jgi:hypothetical protein
MSVPDHLIDEDPEYCVHGNLVGGCRRCDDDFHDAEEEHKLQVAADRERGATDYAAGVSRARSPFGDMLRRALWEEGWDYAEEAAMGAMEPTQHEINLPLVGGRMAA